MQRSFYQKYLNTEHTALLEQDNHEGMLYGFTDNYIKVKVPFNEKICRSKQQIKLLEIDSDGIMKAELLATKK